MALDSSIYGAIQNRRPTNRLAEIAQVMQVQGLQQDGEMARMKMDAMREDRARSNKLTQLLSTGADSAALRQGGFLKESMELDKAAGERAKADADAAKARTEVRMKGLTVLANTVRGVKDQAGYDNAFMLAEALGEKVDGIPRQYNPQLVEQIAGALTTQVQQWQDQRDREKNAETGRHNRATEGINAGQLAVSQGNLKLRKDELDNARNAPRGQFLETPTGYVLADPRGGTVQPVLGPDGQQLRGKTADRSLNETQAKANLFGTRMKEAHAILNELEGKGVTNAGLISGAIQGAVGLTPFVGDKLSDAAGSVMNTVPGALGGPNAAQQRVGQARRDFINAVLRRESGAAIAASEFANADRQYFPQPGDSKDVIDQKRRNREAAIRGLEVEVPGGFRGPKASSTDQTGQSGSGIIVDFGSLK